MKRVRQIFVADRPGLLSRWIEAFPDAVLSASSLPVASADGGLLVWLELSADTDSTAAITRIRQEILKSKFVVLANEPSDDQAVRCFSLGASGYCNAHASPETLKNVADVVLRGGLWLGETLLQRLIGTTVGAGFSSALSPAVGQLRTGDALSERQHEVANAVATGASNKEIARRLGITERTVKAHVGAAFEKLGVRDRLQLAIRFNQSPSD